jgi:hypothetical protein
VPGPAEIWDALRPFAGKTDFGPLRFLHFLALAYLAWVAVGPMGARLSRGTWWPRVVAVVMKVGRQSLAVFVAGLVLSRLLGVALDLRPRPPRRRRGQPRRHGHRRRQAPAGRNPRARARTIFGRYSNKYNLFNALTMCSRASTCAHPRPRDHQALNRKCSTSPSATR